MEYVYRAFGRLRGVDIIRISVEDYRKSQAGIVHAHSNTTDIKTIMPGIWEKTDTHDSERKIIRFVDVLTKLRVTI